MSILPKITAGRAYKSSRSALPRIEFTSCGGEVRLVPFMNSKLTFPFT
jgi:hypothetical protein